MSRRGFKAPRPSTSAQNLCPGFQSGGGKPVTDSPAELARATSNFANEDLDANSNRSGPSNVMKNVTFDNQFTTCGRPLPDDQVSVAPQSSSALTYGMGFQMCSGKPVTLSAEAVARAKSMFKDENLGTSVIGMEPLEASKSVPPAESMPSNSSRDFPGNPTAVLAGPSSSAQMGFQMCSGKPVKLSATALAKGKSVFSDEDLGSMEKANNSTFANQFAAACHHASDGLTSAHASRTSGHNIYAAFQTGSGKPVKFPAASLEKVKTRFTSEDLNLDSMNNPLCVTKTATFENQFTTAGNRTPDHASVLPNTRKKKSDEVLKQMFAFVLRDDKDTEEDDDKSQGRQCSQEHEDGREQDQQDDEDKRERIDEDDERELSPILDPRQIEFFSRSKVCKSLSPSFAVAAASTPTPALRITNNGADIGETSPKVPRMFSKIRNLMKTGSPGPSPKRTKVDSSTDLSGYTQEVSELVKDLLADDEKCELLGDDSFFMSTSMIPSLVSTSVIQSRENGRLAQLNVVKHRLNTTKPTEGFLVQLRKMYKGNRIKMGTHAEMTHPKQYSEEELLSYNVKKSVIDVKSQNALSFRFDGVEFFGKDVTLTNTDGIAVGDEIVLMFGFDCALGVREIAAGFMSNSAVDPSLISLEWVSNHYRWIVWTLATYEMKFPPLFGGVALTPENLLLRLKYRYDREIDKSERSAIRRIVEHDDSPGKRMILFISNIHEGGTAPNANVAHDSDEQSGDALTKTTANLELSDGWYSIDSVCDSVFLSFIEKGMVTIGTKLIMHGAELISAKPMHPLEAKGKALLKFGTNSVRRAKWNSRLGFCDTPSPFPVPVGSIIGNGGLIPLLHLTIARVYPIVYHCKVDGKSEFYPQKYFDKMQRENEGKREREMERLYAEVRKEVESDRRKSGAGRKIPARRDDVENMNAETILDLMECTDDAISIQLMLSMSKLQQVRAAQEKRQQEIQDSIQKRVQEKMTSLEKDFQPDAVPFVKIRVIDASTAKDKVRDTKYSAMLSIWRPPEDLLSCLSEGLSFKIFSLSPSNSDGNSPKRITATKSSKFLPLPLRDKEVLDLIVRKCYRISDIIEDDFNPIFNEFDTVGLIVYISPPLPNGQTVYIADENENIVGIRLWSPIANQGLEEVLALHNFIAASNLSWRSSSCKSIIRTSFWQESTIFTHHPKHFTTKNDLEELKTKLGKGVKKYAEKCEMTVYRLLSFRSTSTTPQNPTPPTSSSSQGVRSQKSELFKNFGSPPKLPPTPLLTSSVTLKRLSNKFQVPRRVNHEAGK